MSQVQAYGPLVVWNHARFRGWGAWNSNGQASFHGPTFHFEMASLLCWSQISESSNDALLFCTGGSTIRKQSYCVRTEPTSVSLWYLPVLQLVSCWQLAVVKRTLRRFWPPFKFIVQHNIFKDNICEWTAKKNPSKSKRYTYTCIPHFTHLS